MTPRFAIVTALAAAFAALAASPSHAQADAAPQLAGPAPSADKSTYQPALVFDVGSVRETHQSAQFQMNIVNPPHKSTFGIDGLTLHVLLLMAYGPTPFQVAGGPDWIDDRYFAVHANSDPSVDDQLAKLSDDQARLEKAHMLQALLADRFHLRAHWETREGPILAMTIAKSGLKMQSTKLSVPDAGDPNAAPTTPSTGVHAHGSPQGIEIDGGRFAMRSIAAMLTTQIKTNVVDRTGDKGYYDFALQVPARDDMAWRPGR